MFRVVLSCGSEPDGWMDKMNEKCESDCNCGELEESYAFLCLAEVRIAAWSLRYRSTKLWADSA